MSVSGRPKGLLLDMDGVIYVGDRPIEGANETIGWLRSHGIPFQFTTNTTTLSTSSLVAKMQKLGLPLQERDIFGVNSTAVAYLEKLGSPSCHFVLTDDALTDFKSFRTDNSNPEVVVLGDIGESWSYSLVNDLFHKLIGGATLVALHKGKYWHTEAGLCIDLGALVAGLEYATGITATVIGKPSPEFFSLAQQRVGMKPSEMMMIGDDLDNDIAGAQACGIRGVLVKTGKFRQELFTKSRVLPYGVIDSIAELPQFFKGQV